jgi:hypothetical protein
MAIKVENITVGGRTLIKHSSDSNKYIRQVETGIEYASAVDEIPCRFTYEETEREIEEVKVR